MFDMAPANAKITDLNDPSMISPETLRDIIVFGIILLIVAVVLIV
jgi:hypothetical protein